LLNGSGVVADTAMERDGAAIAFHAIQFD